MTQIIELVVMVIKAGTIRGCDMDQVVEHD
jgi:hypothetical protein